MARLIDTTIRLLSQEPLAGAVPTSELLRLAEILDRAGYAALEVSGGGAFDAAVRAGIESPWERIRALRARTQTPLAIAVRGRFLVGARPVGDDLVRRFIDSAAASGIDAFRLHDPLNDADNLRVAAEAVRAAGREFDAGIVYGTNGHATLVETAQALAAMGTGRIVLADPAGLLEPPRAGELVAELRELTGLPVGLYCQGAASSGIALALEAARAGADAIACALYPVALTTHRISAEALAGALAGIGCDPGLDCDLLWEGSDLVDAHIGDRAVAPLVPRVSVKAARRKLPFALVSVIDAQLRNRGQRDRLDEVLDEIARVRREVGLPPLAAPLGQIVGSQALVNVLGASRYATILDELRDLVLGRFGRTPAPVDDALRRAVDLLPAEPGSEPMDIEAARAHAKGLASSEEDLLLLVLFGEEAEPLLRSIRARGGAEPGDGPGSGERERQIRSVVEILRETGVGEITVEEEGVRISVRGLVEPPPGPGEAPPPADSPVPAEPLDDRGLIAIESPMVGTFYRRPSPEAAPFVEEGDPVSPGSVLCILEAMKLMNEVKAEVEAIVRVIHVVDGAPVEYGQLLFELEPLNGRPVGF